MERVEVGKVATELVLGQQGASNALSVPGTAQLSDADGRSLTTLMRQMQAYYPHQEFLEDTVESYLFDMARLAAKYGLNALRAVLLDLRLRPGQRFFPHPTQVLEELEAVKHQERIDQLRANPYTPDPECKHVTPGWERRVFSNGDSEVVRCACFLRWKGLIAEADRKTVAAGQ